MSGNRISTGSYDLNKWLFGGYERDIITTVYGPAGSGKTNFCVLVTVSQAKKDNKVIFIDTEGGFSPDRFKQMTGEEYEKSVKNVLLLKPTNFNEQKKIFDSLLKEINSDSKIGLIIVDSMTMLYRLEIADELSELNSEYKDSKIKSVNRELARQLRTLAEISRKKNIPVIITNQIYYNFIKDEQKTGEERIAKMVGGDLLKYWSKCLIELKSENGKRNAILRKHRSLPEKELNFVISNEGIRKKSIF
ncbi:MAG TPA: DNA repair and recombination protein RadB [Candidatus Nanoarchaeia archaeon]|nr:DNA repair and recombination protein RadB [Candidatus Nanoarchaeia archaeon]